MWTPRSEAEIQAGVENGLSRESPSFDAKAALPPSGRNKDLAKDICAMTVDGGSLLYGLGGEDPTRPDRRQPFDLAGAAERVDQVAQTGIAEPPVIEVYDIPSEAGPGLAYLCVVVPASPRAPHMLTIDGDNRYWGRGATGNRILSEGEVARLYERRARWDLDRDQMVGEAVAAMPFTFDVSRVGPMVTIVRPVVPGRELLRIAAGGRTVDEFVRDQVLAIARRSDPYPDQGTSGLGDAYGMSRVGADRWLLTSQQATDPGFEYQARAEFKADGSLVYWHSPVLNTNRQGNVLVMERSVTRAVCQALAAAGFIFEQAGFNGSVDIGIAVLGIIAASGATVVHAFTPRVYGAPEYRRHERVTSQELQTELDALVRRLLAPMFEVISVQGYDPLADRT